MAGNSDGQDEVKDEDTAASVWLDFCDYSSTHGPNHIKRSARFLGKVIWTVITLIFTAILLWQITELFIKFLKFDVNVLIDIKYEKDLKFPAVTVCNLNPFSGGVFILTKVLFKCTFCHYFYTYTSIVHFVPVNNEKYLCVLRHAGLTLELFVEMDEYIPDLTEEAGFRVLVHGNDEVPFPEINGFNIPVGMATGVGIRLQEIVRLGQQYSDCKPNSTSTNNIYSHIYPNGYSNQVCQMSCYQEHVANECGCLDSAYPTDHPSLPVLPECGAINMTVGLNDSGVLASGNSADVVCMKREFQKYTDGTIVCTCENVCSQHDYLRSMSMSAWPLPHPASILEKRDDLIAENQPGLVDWLASTENLTKYELMDEFSANFGKLRIYFEDLNYQKIYQTPAYTWTNLLSELGGQLGLWIGMSVMSILEWFELCAFCLRTLTKANDRVKRVGPRKI
ncbi:hypothetical protein CAPTEDRAFT_166424 [Capitella teleta]|uniref:Uncharacterized protein n=1 Tax=Capitella teleta TaxID=283909 RepID=R7TPX8_CAPTE|nr:hypothetical protein CAPTEDRAFT_166424 [Capitella teleta]|eukprot:ELT93095.1 hypothetical protein CAPTEDRAFT_166424 [Capitella teleta]